MSGVPDVPEWEFDDPEDRRVALFPFTHVAVSVAARRTAIGATAALLCAGIAAGVVISQEGSGSGGQGAKAVATKPVVTKPAPAVTLPTAAPRSHAKSAAKPVATHHAKTVKVTHHAVSTPPPTVAAPQAPSAPSPTASASSSSPPTHAPAKTASRGSLTTTHKATVTNHSVAPAAPAKPKASTQTTTSTTIKSTTVATTNNCPGLGIGPLCL